MYLVFDLGATKLRISSSIDGKNLVDTLVFDSPKSENELINLFKSYRSKFEIKKVAGCIPGILDENKSMNTFNLNLPFLVDFPLKNELEKCFSCPVLLENDAMCAGLGEAVFGSGQGERIIAYLTISSGVGGARIVDGKIDVNSNGFEPGYQVVDFDGSYEKFKNDRYPNEYGYLQRLISGEDIEKKFSRNPENIEDSETWDKMNTVLAFGVSNTIVYWSPDVVILGGSISMNRIDLKKLASNIEKVLFMTKKIPKLKFASLTDNSGLYGALALIK